MKSLMLGVGMIGSLAFTPRAIEPHPHLASAVVELQAARKELQTAAHDFGGHRVAALRAVDNAIKQIQIAQRYDKQ